MEKIKKEQEALDPSLKSNSKYLKKEKIIQLIPAFEDKRRQNRTETSNQKDLGQVSISTTHPKSYVTASLGRNIPQRTTDFKGRVFEVNKSQRPLPSLLKQTPMEIASIKDGDTISGNIPGTRTRRDDTQKSKYAFKERSKFVIEEYEGEDCEGNFVDARDLEIFRECKVDKAKVGIIPLPTSQVETHLPSGLVIDPFKKVKEMQKASVL